MHLAGDPRKGLIAASQFLLIRFQEKDMSRNLKIAAAVVVAMSAGSAAQALVPTATVDLRLYVAGASAQRDTILQEVTNICQPATQHNYRALPTAGQDFRAYSCTLLNAAPVPANLRNKNVIVYYRSEGGSIYGVGSLAKNLSVQELQVNATVCPGPTYTVAPAFNDCNVSGFDLDSDTVTSGLAKHRVDLGVSDVEPTRFVGENWNVTPFLGAAPTGAQLSAITAQTATGTVFGVAVNSALAIEDLSTQDLTSIFSGTYGDWSQVAATNNTVDASGEIKVCRREVGSGTQVAMSIYANNQGCNAAGYPFVTEPATLNFGNPVQHVTTTGLMGTCIAGHPGAIGFLTYTATPPAGTKWVTLNGKTPGKIAAALGDYDLWFESTFNTDEYITSSQPADDAGGLRDDLAAYLVSRARTAATIPVNDSAFALYNAGTNFPLIPADTSRPIALATRSGNSCARPQGTF
jgi:hypothetical protein